MYKQICILETVKILETIKPWTYKDFLKEIDKMVLLVLSTTTGICRNQVLRNV